MKNQELTMPEIMSALNKAGVRIDKQLGNEYVNEYKSNTCKDVMKGCAVGALAGLATLAAAWYVNKE